MKHINILLVEDNEGDILLITEAFEEWRILNTINVARDGKTAIEIISKQAALQDHSLPDLILMDVNLPKKNGHEVLKFIKANPDTKHIPVIILTTSSSEKDIMQSYLNNANCYIVKPVEVDQFLKVVASIENFWISVVQLPKN